MKTITYGLIHVMNADVDHTLSAENMNDCCDVPDHNRMVLGKAASTKFEDLC